MAGRPGDAPSRVNPRDARFDPGGPGDSAGRLRTGTRVVNWELVYTKQAQRDAKKLAASGLRDKAEALLTILRTNPFQSPPPFEKLVGDLAGAYSRRINVQHRLVYQILKRERMVKVLRMWTHYE